MSTAAVKLPVWRRDEIDGPEYRCIDVEVDSVGESEAPLAARYSHKGKWRDFRTYNGLYWRAVPHQVYGYLAKDLLRCSFAQNPREIAFDRCWKFRNGNRSSPALDRLADSLYKPLSKEFLLVDEVLHHRSFGPLRICYWTADIEKPGSCLADFEQQIKYVTRSAHLTLSAASVDTERPLVESHFPGVSFYGEVDYLTRVAPDPDLLAASAERALWSFLFRANMAGQSMSLSLAETTLRIRSFLKDRWPGLNLEPSDHKQPYVANHLLQRDLPPARDVHHMLAEIAQCAEEAWGRRVAGTYRIVDELVSRSPIATLDPDEVRELGNFGF